MREKKEEKKQEIFLYLSHIPMWPINGRNHVIGWIGVHTMA
jgi:hypothetical protein